MVELAHRLRDPESVSAVNPVMSAAFTPEQIQWLQDHADDTLVPSIHIANGICVAAATISVVLRYFARRSGGANLGRDDYCLFLAYVSSLKPT